MFDVRSPGEYAHAHIPGARNLPLFSDEERKVVGTAYKQQSRETAIKQGLDYFGVKMRAMVETVEQVFPQQERKTVLVHCWRGGMRSGAVAWLLNLYGFEVYTLAGGYKAYRKWVLKQFEKQWDLKVLSGYTGSGKTELLHKLERQHKIIIDLESLASHKGSAFGKIPGKVQPGQEMFENMLADALDKIPSSAQEIWIEDESQRIGLVNIPNAFWQSMRSAPLFFLDVPFEQRLEHVIKEYGNINKEELINSIIRISKRLGGLETKNAINYLLENDIHACFSILLRYYDKQYLKALKGRNNLDKLLKETNAGEILSA